MDMSRLENGDNINALMREYNVGSSTISDIKAQKDKLLEAYTKSETDKADNKRHTSHKPKMEQLDKVLDKWFTPKCLERAPISGPMLLEKAKYFYDQMGMTDQCAFSDGCLACFKLDISRRTKVCRSRSNKFPVW